ncbi:MAG: hypothetical protein LQ339_005345 [Xanthoria mediterranea]|nr:MAG: hypothetical protein LQ339_005345 [Xanthoria mediterranea]
MASSVNPRSAAYNDRRNGAASAKPRLPSSRTTPKERPISSGDIVPEDSASNAPQRPNPSSRTNGYSRNTTERQTTRIQSQLTTRESLHVRTKSPLKKYAVNGDNADTLRPRSEEYGRLSSPVPATTAVPETEKRNLQRYMLAPWKPQASLIPHTTAPLASRICLPPLASLLPESLQPPPLKQLTPHDQEAAILDDLLYVLMGFEGQYIRYEESYNPSVEKDRLDGPSFSILPGLDPSLRDLTNSVLKMATYYSAIEAFVEVQSREEFGAISHALCASIRKLLKDYLILIAQLENQLITDDFFSLHVLHLHTLPTNQMMFQVYTLAQEIVKKSAPREDDPDESVDDFNVDDIIMQLKQDGELVPGGMSKTICKGGNVLRLLTDRLSYMCGDPAARTLLQSLLRDASRPYMTMLNEWLHHGGIKDPHAEFLIREQKSIRREKLEEDYTDEYWEKRYTIREGDVPPQLEAVKDKVLLAGKYLNVVRECGGVDISTEVDDVPRSFDDPRFLENINNAYSHANSSLLSLLLTTHALPARLQSMKHYFFLDHSDFFTYFLDLSASELKKPVRNVNVSKLQSLLDLVLRQPGSIAAQDPFKEDVKVQMNDVGLTKFLMGVVNVRGIDQDESTENAAERYRTPATHASSTEEDNNNNMTGFEALEFKFSVPFPLSLVISSKTVLRYQILFRYLLSMRHLENLLLNSWEDHNKVLSWTHRSEGDRRLEMFKRRAWTLRSRMLVFVQQFTYYCTAEVIEPNWQRLMAKVNGHDQDHDRGPGSPPKVGRTVDELMEDHVDFLDTCLKECMLMNAKLLKYHSKLTSVCTLFATQNHRQTRDLFPPADSTLVNPPAAKLHHRQQHLPVPTNNTTTTKGPSHPSSSTSTSTTNQPTHDPTKLPAMEDWLAKYENHFNHHLSMLLRGLDYYAATETVALGRLCAQLSSAGETGGRERIAGAGGVRE